MSVAANLPSSSADGSATATPTRTGSYGEAYALSLTNKELFSADEGSYFTAITPTPGTGIIGHAAPTTFDEAKPFIVIYNGSLKRLYPQFLRLHETVASIGGARSQFTITTDDGNRRSSAGTALTINQANLGSSQSASGVLGYIGAVIGTAATGARLIHDHIVFRGTIDIVEDALEIVWGGAGGGNSTASRVATVMDASRTTGPLVVMPGDSLCITQWAAAQSTGPTYQAELGFILR
jgi:hypothetical protein